MSARGGSRVVQVISRNHSNVSKSAFVISQVLCCSSRNQLTFLFYCLSWNKTKKEESHLVIPSITQQTQPSTSLRAFARIRPLSILPRTTRPQAADYRANYWQSYIKGSFSLEVPSFVLVEFRLDFIVNLPRRKTRFWFINHGSRRSSLSEGGLFSARYWLGLLFKQISSYSDQDKLKFVENVWKRLTRWAIWLPIVSGMFEFYPSFCVELAEKISLASIL